MKYEPDNYFLTNSPVQRELACRYLGLEALIARAVLSMDTHDPDPIDTLDVEGVGVGHL